jgi:hypothetical protein
VIEDAYSDGEIMTEAELYVFWNMLFYSCYNAVESPDPFKLRGKCPMCPMVKNWLIHLTRVADLGFVMMVVVAFEHVCDILRKPMHQLLHAGSSHSSIHALHCSDCPLGDCLVYSPTAARR